MKTETAKERILLAAGPIFAAKGFETATVREICRAADVNVASINYHFGDKKGLYTQTLFLARDLREQQVPLPAWTNEESADEKLKIFIELLLRRIVAMRTEPWEVRLLLREVMHPSDAAPPLIENYFRPFLDQLMSIVDEVLEHHLPDHQRHQIGFSIIGQCLHYRVSGEMISLMISEDEYESHFDIQNLVDHIWRFSLGGLHGIRDSISGNSPSVADQVTR